MPASLKPRAVGTGGISGVSSSNFSYFFYPDFFSSLIYLSLYLLLAALGLHCFLHRLSLVAASRGYSLAGSTWASHWDSFSCCRARALRCAGFSRCGSQTPECGGSEVAEHGLSCPEACGIFPDQRSNPCPLQWQVDSLPLDHQRSP